DRALELEPGASLHTDGARFVPDVLTLVTPPWNFPVAIPIGGVLAALAAGSAVVIKPAPPVPGCTEIAVAALHAAGIPDDVLQVVRTDEGEVGRALVAHEGVDTVVLTGAVETAELFSSWRAGRPGGPRVLGEADLVIKPAPPVPGCTEIAVAALHAAGIPDDVLQVVRTDEGEVGRALVAHEGVDTVVLTGAVETAELFSSWRAGRPGGPRVLGE